MPTSENLISSESTETIVRELSIRYPKDRYETNPYIFGGELQLPSVDLAYIIKLTRMGLLVLAHISDKYFKNDSSTRLEVKELCKTIYGNYTDNLGTNIRRGIKDLLQNNVIVHSDTKDIYWVNPTILWIK